ncbi:MAG: dipeptidase [Chitinophagaceae bacterium]|jgi:membrane dipeptidase|nr:dipeptidase [Chitinophagaceae bacterium]
MKLYLVFFTSLLLLNVSSAQNYLKLHRTAILVDTHNDILEQCLNKGYSFDNDLRGKTQSDLQRFKQGGVDVQVFSVWCDGEQKNPYAYANRMIDTVYAVAQRHPDELKIVYNSKQMFEAVRHHQLAAMFGVEGGHMIEDNLNNLDNFYKRGVRYMTLTWNNSNDWATSAADESGSKPLPHKGLTDFGKQVVQRMNALGMMVDVSHVGEQTFWDVINTTTKPVLASHSSVYNLCPVSRNLKDEQIKAIAKNGGVIQVNFFSGFIDSNYHKKSIAFTQAHQKEMDSLLKINPDKYLAEDYLFAKYSAEVESLRAPFDLVIQHIDYIVQLVGVDYVGIGSDFDGITSAPQKLDDVTTYPLITKALLEKGYSPKDIRKILGENFIRVLKANER